jgi:DNA-binding transcriptional regulator GbsR (MarR family)
MSSTSDTHSDTRLPAAFSGLDPELAAEINTFEVFFKSFGFKRIHGRVWGLLVLAGQPLSNKEIVSDLGISQGAASTTINELAEWGAIRSSFDTTRRCNLHEPVGNTLSIVATVLRRREQVAFQRFRVGMTRMLALIKERHGARDPRVMTLRSILTTCEIADAVMQLVFSAVGSALGDSQSLLTRAITTALKVGGVPGKMLAGGRYEDAQDVAVEESAPEDAGAEDTTHG